MIAPIILPKFAPRDGAIERIGKILAQLDRNSAWRVEIREHRPVRSNAQNAYLNGICYKLIGDAVGYEREEVSEYLLGQYFGWKDKRVPRKPSNPTGIESVPVRTTTTDAEGRPAVLTKAEFSDYIAFVQRFAAGKGVFIPDPES
jgi:hypothetical protein